MKRLSMSIGSSAVVLLQFYSPDAAAVTYEGPLYSSGRCTPNMLMFKVDVDGDKANGEWGYDAGAGAPFSGATSADGFTAERHNRNGALQRVFATKTAAGYDIIINGARCNWAGRIKTNS